MKRLLAFINYYWRILATGFCFLIFGMGALVLGYFLVPIVNIITRDKQQRGLRNQRLIHMMFRFFVGMMSHVGVAEFKFKDFDKLAKDKGLLIISNHPTLIDYVIIVSRLKHCVTIVKEELFQHFITKNILSSSNYISNEKSVDTLEKIQSGLNQGNNLLLFPEGTRTEPGQPMILQRGAAHIALRASVPVRIITITTNHHTLTKKNKWYQVPPSKVKYTISADELVDPRPFLEKAGALPLAARHLTSYFTKAFQQR